MSEITFKLTVVSPDKSLLVDVPVTAVGAKGTEGDFTALAYHVPFLTDLKPGEVWYQTPDGVRNLVSVSGGFIEVLPDKVTVLADSCEFPDEIDEERAKRAKQRAELKLKQAHELAAQGLLSSDQEAEMRKAEIKLHRALARIKTVDKSRSFKR
ncbi:MAG: ATP synthase F1 subunit epsilon [Deltaproteobacteria bacterium]|jgi:F-type H+-transporting ATPase subunit epsilon|nr:ATP synthase F1 subunit epsilon [Deltaproteobacteria bacterium]